MGSRAYLAVSATIFGLVAILHLLRAVNGWVFVVGSWSVPVWVSWAGALLPAVLCVWALRLVSRVSS